MIVAIADDISGAAELAGIGLRYGLDVEMSTVVNRDSKAGLLVIATDTRSMKEKDATAEIKKITGEVMQLLPSMVFKKIDSVLRGHVVAELNAQLKILNYGAALVVAANPSLGRTISDGMYFYNDKPIHQSSFSIDPEFPVKSSDVLKMLRVNTPSVQVKKNTDELPVDGIIVGEVADNNDLHLWAKRIKRNTLPAGASDFFSAILDTRFVKNIKQTNIEEPGQPALFVCGSTFNRSREAIQEIKSKDGPVSYMPDVVLSSPDNDDENYQLWSNEVVAFIQSKGKAIISIDPGAVKDKTLSAAVLRKKTAIVVDRVFKQENIHELFIEGGSTAAAVIRQLGFETFIPVKELAPGVVRMRIKEREDLFITIKPGSYQWPGAVWDFE